jgi:hypothetical protein
VIETLAFRPILVIVRSAATGGDTLQPEVDEGVRWGLSIEVKGGLGVALTGEGKWWSGLVKTDEGRRSPTESSQGTSALVRPNTRCGQ